MRTHRPPEREQMAVSRANRIKKPERHSGAGKCVSCSQPISTSARRCHKCGGLQHWRYAIFSAPSIAVVIASASLTVSLYPLARDAILSRSTVLNASLQAANLEAVSILVQNSGGRPATFVQANLTVIDQNKTHGLTIFKPKNAGPSEAAIIQPNSSALVELTPIAQQGWAFSGSKSQCEMSFHFIDFQGALREKNSAVDCDVLTGYVLILAARYRALIRNAEEAGGHPFRDGPPMMSIDDETITSLRDDATAKGPALTPKR